MQQIVSQPFTLGILDTATKEPQVRSETALWQVVTSAQIAESCGFDRYWLAEHHTKLSYYSSSEVLIPIIANQTSRIRVGAGGILLSYYSPLKIAECFTAMHALFPNRIELGVCWGPGVDDKQQRLDLVCANAHELTRETFNAKVADLCGLFERRVDNLLTFQPNDATLPPLWLLGGSSSSFGLATRYNMNFGFMCYSKAAWQAGKDLFTAASTEGSAPASVATRRAIAVTIDCEGASTNALITGSPGDCVAMISAIANDLGATDVVLVPSAPTRSARDECIRQIAASFQKERVETSCAGTTSTALVGSPNNASA
jgi:luciferase family oxidoreductase group 1